MNRETLNDLVVVTLGLLMLAASVVGVVWMSQWIEEHETRVGTTLEGRR